MAKVRPLYERMNWYRMLIRQIVSVRRFPLGITGIMRSVPYGMKSLQKRNQVVMMCILSMLQDKLITGKVS